jgi:hypothetical protein
MKHFELDVSIEKVLGSTVLWRLDLVCAKERPAKPLMTAAQGIASDAYGLIAVPEWTDALRHVDAPALDTTIRVDLLYALGPVLLIGSADVTVTLPKSLVETVATRLAFRPRTPETLRDVAAQVRELVLKARMPAEHILPAVTFGTLLAFNCNTQNEIDVLQTVTTRFAANWTRLHQLLELRPLRACPTYFPWIILAVGTSLVIVLFSVHQSWSLEAGVSLWAVTCLVTILGFMFVKAARFLSRWLGDDWLHTLRFDRRAAPIRSAQSFEGRQSFPGTHALREPLIPDTEAATIRVVSDPHPPRHPGADPPIRQILSGIGIADHVPTVVEPNQAAELSGVTNRMAQPALPVDVDFHAAYCTVMDTIDLGGPVLDNDDLFQKWVLKFPVKQRELLTAARRDAIANDPNSKDRKFRGFTKEEKGKVMSVLGEKLTKPRIINQPTDRVKAIVGPFVDSCAKLLRKAWDGISSRWCYVSGMTADKLGEVFDLAIQKHGGWGKVVVLVLDFEVYDSTVRKELFEPRSDLYSSWGMSAKTRSYLEAMTASGITRHGVMYTIKGKDGEPDIEIMSGVMDTNLWGSLVNGGVTETAYIHASEPHVFRPSTTDEDMPSTHDLVLHSLAQHSSDHTTFVCGDDGMVVMPAAAYNELFGEVFLSTLKGLGLKPTMIVARERHEVEFCSKLAWLGKTKDGRVQTVFGAKPGRILHRMGWNLTVPGSLNLYGACVSVGRDNAHVPLIPEFVNATRSLIPETERVVKGREWTDFAVSRTYQCTPANYTLLLRRYGVTGEDCKDLRKLFKGVKELPAVVNHPAIQRMIEIDTA